MRALQIFASKSWPDPILVKLGERKHMASLLLEGMGRISLAKTYDDPSLGHARTDDESQTSVYVHPMDAHRPMTVVHYPNGSRGADEPIQFLHTI